MGKKQTDLVASRGIAKALPDPGPNNPGSHATQKKRKSAWELFNAVRAQIYEDLELTEKALLKQVPTFEDIKRFIVTVVGDPAGIYKPIKIPQIVGKKLISLSTIKGNIYRITEWCENNYRGWKLDNLDNATLKTILKQTVADGLTRTGRWFNRQAIGYRAVTHMISACLFEFNRNGTDNWDIIISRILTVSLAVATGCRAGALTLSDGCNNNECLCYEDIKIIVQRPPPEQALTYQYSLKDIITCEIHLKHDKGHKETPDPANKHRISPQLDNPTVCPIVWLFVHTLRHALVLGGTTLHQVLKHAASRQDQDVEWAKPSDPVICALLNRPFGIQIGVAARVTQALDSMKILGKISGFRYRVTFHGLRYGAAEDNANLPDHVKPNHNPENARLLLGHSRQSFMAGVTDKYTGCSKWDSAAARNLYATVDPLQRGLFKHPDESLELDPNKHKADLAISPGFYGDNPYGEKLKHIVDTTTMNLSNSSTSHRNSDDEEDALMNDPDLIDKQIEEAERNDAIPYSKDVDEDRSHENQSGTNVWLDVDSQEQFEESESTSTQSKTGDEFVAYYSTINTSRSYEHGSKYKVKHERNTKEAAEANLPLPGEDERRYNLNWVPTGGSRAVPTAFMFQCINEGCGYSNKSKSNVTSHSHNHCIKSSKAFQCNLCKLSYASERGLLSHRKNKHLGQGKQFKCDSCEDVFQSAYGIQKHHKRKHEDEPEMFTCTTCDIQYSTKSGLMRHNTMQHSGKIRSTVPNIPGPSEYVPKRCPLEECHGREHVFEKAENLCSHFRKHHRPKDLSKEALLEVRMAEHKLYF